MLGRIFALFLLGSALVKTLLLRLGTPRTGKLAFDETYGEEGLVAVLPDESLVLQKAGGCVACGRCDRGEGSRIAKSPRYRGIQAFVLAGTRSMPDYSTVANDIREVPDEALVEAERECPENVPIKALADLVRGYAKRNQGAV